MSGTAGAGAAPGGTCAVGAPTVPYGERVDIRRGIAGVGRTMIAAGVLILLFVAYQLWGTGLAEARYQRRMTKEFERALAEPGPTPTSAPAPASTEAPVPGATAVPTTAAQGTQAPPAPPDGDAVAILKIPKLGVEKAVVQGVTLNLLKRGPGHYPGTPLPGQPGNAAIAGHRTTYGAPFFRLNELDPGDPILVTTRQGRFRYEVSESRVVKPNQTAVLRPSTDDRLTLTTCNPRFSAAQRLIVVALLKGEAAEPPPAPVTTTVPSTIPGDATSPSTVAPTTTSPAPPPLGFEEAESAGLSGRNAANGPAIGWGAAAAAVWLFTWLLARRWRKWPAYALGTPVFLVVLFVFFENFSRLLPANF